MKGKAYLVGTNIHSFRSGEPALIKGVVWSYPKDLERRLCYVVEYDDGFIDYVAMHDKENYKVLTFLEMCALYPLNK